MREPRTFLLSIDDERVGKPVQPAAGRQPDNWQSIGELADEIVFQLALKLHGEDAFRGVIGGSSRKDVGTAIPRSSRRSRTR